MRIIGFAPLAEISTKKLGGLGGFEWFEFDPFEWKIKKCSVVLKYGHFWLVKKCLVVLKFNHFQLY
jgi:hypothetical protein